MRFLILGPLEVIADGGEPLPIAGSKERSILADLIANAGRVVSVDALIGEMWGEQLPRNPEKALWSYLSRLRRALGHPESSSRDIIATRGDGYVLELAGQEIDALRFEELADDGRTLLEANQPTEALSALDEALGLWRGTAYEGYRYTGFGSFEGERLEELRRSSVEDRIDAKLAIGEAQSLIADLEAMVREEPLRERRWGQLILALYRAGRQAEALQAFTRARAVLVDELGVEPGPALQRLQRAVLDQDPTIECPSPNAPERVSSTDVCPYKGLARFEISDAEFYFGREQTVARAVARLVEGRFLALVGASGSGKSSLLRAGVLHALRSGAIPGSDGCTYVSIRPGRDPLRSFEDALGRSSRDRSRPLVVAIDQFEEVFTACDDEAQRAAALQRIADAVVPDGTITVIIAMRADYYARCADHRAFAELMEPSQILVGPMDGDELRRAIELPATRTHLVVEDGLADALVQAAAGQPGGLPLLSTALLELWTQRRDRTLTLEAYVRSGGIEGAVARLAEDAYARMDEPARTAAKRILLRLAAPGDGPDAVAQQVPIADLDLDHDEDGRRAFVVLTDARLLTVANPVVEVAHEALLRDWPRLHAWLEDDVQGRNLHRHLTDAARNWDEEGRDDADLYRGARLTATLEWADEHERDPNELERGFLAASKTASEGEAARARATNRRLKGLLVGVAVFLVVAIVAGSIAFVQRQRAERSATAALAQSLGAQAVSEQHLDLAMLLAREAVNLDPSLATRSDLLSTLLRAPTVIRIFHPLPARGRALALSPDGSLLAFRSNEDVRIAETDTGKQIGTRTKSTGAIAFGPDDNLVRAVGKEGNALAVTDPRTGTIRRTIPRPPTVDGSSLITAIVFDPAGVRMAVRFHSWESKPDDIAQFDYSTGRLAAPIIQVPAATTPAGLPVSDMVYSADARRLLAFGKDLEVFDAWSASIIHHPFPQAGSVVGALSPDGHTVALGQGDGSIRFFDLRTRSMVTRPAAHGRTVEGVRFTPDGKMLISSGRDGTLFLWDVASHRILTSLKGQVPKYAIGAASIAPDGSVFYTQGNGEVLEWDLTGSASFGRTVIAAATHPAHLQSGTLAVSPNSTTFAVGSTTGKVYLRDVTTLQSTGTFQGLTGSREVDALSWSHDGRLLLVAGNDPAGGPPQVRLWRVDGTPTLARAMEPALSHLTSAAYGPDGTTVAASGTRPGDSDTQGEVVEWSAASGRLVAPPTVLRGGHPVSIAYAASGAIAAAIGCRDSERGTAVVDAVRGTVQQYIDAPETCAVAYSPDGSSLATGDFNGDLKFWDGQTSAPTGLSPPASDGGLTSVAWSPNGDTIATVDWVGNVRLIDVATGQQIGVPFVAWDGPLLNTFPPTRSAVAQFTPDGRDLVVSDDTGRAWVFPVSLQAWEDRACQVANRSFTASEWQLFVPDRPYEPVCSSSG